MVSYVMIDIQNGKLIGIYGISNSEKGSEFFFIKFYTFYERHKNTFLHTFAAAIAEETKMDDFYIGIIT